MVSFRYLLVKQDHLAGEGTYGSSSRSRAGHTGLRPCWEDPTDSAADVSASYACVSPRASSGRSDTPARGRHESDDAPWGPCDHRRKQSTYWSASGSQVGIQPADIDAKLAPSKGTYVLLASLTLILGLAKSSLKRELCSVNRRSLSSCIDILCGRDCSIPVCWTSGTCR